MEERLKAHGIRYERLPATRTLRRHDDARGDSPARREWQRCADQSRELSEDATGNVEPRSRDLARVNRRGRWAEMLAEAATNGRR